MEIVDFEGRTALTTRFRNRNCTNYYILKTNYLTISVTDNKVILITRKRDFLPVGTLLIFKY